MNPIFDMQFDKQNLSINVIRNSPDGVVTIIESFPGFDHDHVALQLVHELNGTTPSLHRLEAHKMWLSMLRECYGELEPVEGLTDEQIVQDTAELRALLENGRVCEKEERRAVATENIVDYAENIKRLRRDAKKAARNGDMHRLRTLKTLGKVGKMLMTATQIQVRLLEMDSWTEDCEVLLAQRSNIMTRSEVLAKSLPF